MTIFSKSSFFALCAPFIYTIPYQDRKNDNFCPLSSSIDYPDALNYNYDLMTIYERDSVFTGTRFERVKERALPPGEVVNLSTQEFTQMGAMWLYTSYMKVLSDDEVAVWEEAEAYNSGLSPSKLIGTEQVLRGHQVKGLRKEHSMLPAKLLQRQTIYSYRK